MPCWGPFCWGVLVQLPEFNRQVQVPTTSKSWLEVSYPHGLPPALIPLATVDM